jgi:tetratricopeptide (TPR) repeat protein
VQLWRALRVVAGARGQLKSAGLEAPFVGRARELRVLKELFHASAEERKAHLVSVTGIAGIGKSRLGWEFYKYFDGIVEGVWWHRGRCLSYGEGVTYWALADMMRMRCRIAEDESDESALEKLAMTVAEHVHDPDERDFVEPRLRQLLDLGGEEQGERQQLFAAWRLFFERMSDTNPVVLVFEDLQWADESLLDFVEYMLEWSRNHPIFVLTHARPELADKRPTWGAAQRAFTSIYLEPLSASAMEELLAGLVPGLSAGVVAKILARAEGIPLYAVETVRMLLDRGLVVEEGPVYRVVGEIGALDVPETLQALIAARLDGLDEAERALVQDAAVLGKTFGSGLLGRVAGRPENEVERILSSLVRKEVLSLQADPRSPEHGQFGFLQDLVRRVAYETLSRRDRKARHLAAAAQIAEAFGEDDVPEVVAAHLVAAYDAAPEAEDAMSIRERASRSYILAGERAMRLAAAGEAQRYFEHAAVLSDDASAEAALIDRAGRMAWVAGKPTEATELLERSRRSYETLGDDVAKALVDARLGEIDFNQGHPQRAVARLRPALAELERVGSPQDVAEVAAQLGRFSIFSGDLDGAAPHLERALTLAEEHDLPETLAQALNSKSVLMLFRLRPRESGILVHGALRVALEHDLHDPALRAYNNVVADLWYRQSFREALSRIDQALDYARRTGERQWEVNFLCGSVGSLDMLGRWDEALARATEVEPHARTEFVRALLLWRVLLLCRRGELAPALELIEANADIARSGNEEFAVGYRALSAYVFAVAGRSDEALDAALAAAAYDGESGDAWWLAFNALDAATFLAPEQAQQVLARVEARRWREGRAVMAQCARVRAGLPGSDPDAELRVAEELFVRLETPFYVAATRVERGEYLLAEGFEDAARELFVDARRELARVGAVPWLDRVDAALGRARPSARLRAAAQAAAAAHRLDRPGRGRSARGRAREALDQEGGEGLGARAGDSLLRPDDARRAGHARQGGGTLLEGDPARPLRRERSVGGGDLRLPESRAHGEGAPGRQRREGRERRHGVPQRPEPARRQGARRRRRCCTRRRRDRHGDRPRRVPLGALREGLRRDRAREGSVR